MMKINAQTGWLEGDVRLLPSPNCDDRAPGEVVDLLVVHGICLPPGEFGGPYIDELFTNRLDENAHPYFKQIAGLQVSAHLLICRDGEVVQYVPFTQRAWHAGVSCFAGRERCNDFSIGIELEGCDDLPYERVQYQRLAELTQLLMVVFPAIKPERVAGHCDIAPGRKSDPGPCFDWSYFRSLLA